MDICWNVEEIHIQLKPLKLIPVIEARLGKVVKQEMFSRGDSLQHTYNVYIVIWFVYLLFSETVF